MSYILLFLLYVYDVLELYFDKQIMEIYYIKYYQIYVNNVNAVLESLLEFVNLLVEELIIKLDQLLADKKIVLCNNVGGYVNYSLFWKGLKKGIILQGDLKAVIECDFGFVDNFKVEFEKAAVFCFGFGWVWLVLKGDKLVVVFIVNQDFLLMGEVIFGVFGFLIMGLDVWEYVYYLKFQNCCLDYIKEFWNVVNWDEAAVCFAVKK